MDLLNSVRTWQQCAYDVRISPVSRFGGGVAPDMSEESDSDEGVGRGRGRGGKGGAEGAQPFTDEYQSDLEGRKAEGKKKPKEKGQP